MKKSLILCVSVLSVLLMLSASALACSCGPKPLILDELARSNDVFEGKIAELGKAEPIPTYPRILQRVSILVTRVYKGDLKPGTTVDILNGDGVMCAWVFEQKDIGKELLVFHDAGGEPKFLSSCSRTLPVKYATSDLSYLQKLGSVEGKTRLSGQVSYYFNAIPDGQSVSGKQLKIVGPGGTRKIATDSNGFFQIYDVPEGEYYIEPEQSPGWKIHGYSIQIAPDPSAPHFYDYGESSTTKRRFYFYVKARGHTNIDFTYSIDNAIRGRVVGPDGEPKQGACVNAIDAEAAELNLFASYNCTDKDGFFVIEKLYNRRYQLVINGDGDARVEQPFATVFYPGVSDRSKASVLTVDAGSRVDVKTFRIPAIVPTSIVEGYVSFSDGLPVRNISVRFEAIYEDKKLEARRDAYTDDVGQFQMTVFSNSTGRIRAQKSLRLTSIEKCAGASKSVVDEESDGWGTIATEWLEISPKTNLRDLRLAFTFPRCDLDH